MTQIITGRPPNFSRIIARFPMAQRQTVIFAYEPHIFAPTGKVSPAIVAHEEVHIRRQKDIGVERWWDRYLSEAPFRYEEELLAHRAEYRYMLGENGSRQMRRSALKIVATKLAAPLYGGMVSVATAMRDLEQ